MTCTITPNDNKLLVEMEETRVTKGGIHMPDISQPQIKRGKVVAAGHGCWNNGTWVKQQIPVGATVILRKHAGTEVESGGKKLHFVENHEVLGVECGK